MLYGCCCWGKCTCACIAEPPTAHLALCMHFATLPAGVFTILLGPPGRCAPGDGYGMLVGHSWLACLHARLMPLHTLPRLLPDPALCSSPGLPPSGKSTFLQTLSGHNRKQRSLKVRVPAGLSQLLSCALNWTRHLASVATRSTQCSPSPPNRVHCFYWVPTAVPVTRANLQRPPVPGVCGGALRRLHQPGAVWGGGLAGL